MWRTAILIGLLFASLPCSSTLANEPLSRETYLAIVKLEQETGAKVTGESWPDSPADGDTVAKRNIWGSSFNIDVRAELYIGAAPLLLPEKARQADYRAPLIPAGRYLAILSDAGNRLTEIEWYSERSGKSWCIPPEVVRKFAEDLTLDLFSIAPDGARCIDGSGLTKAKQEATANSNSRTLVVADLIQQEDTGICDPESGLCFYSVVKGRLSNVREISGTPVKSSIDVKYWFHGVLKGHPTIAMVIWPSQDGSFEGTRPITKDRGAYCFEQSWFYPAQDGMPIPRKAWRNDYNEICFRAY